jgi:hypothetical protein
VYQKVGAAGLVKKSRETEPQPVEPGSEITSAGLNHGTIPWFCICVFQV